MFKSLAAIALLFVGVSAQQGLLTISEPSADHWWVAQSANTLAWSGQSGAPTQFSVFLNNPSPSVLTSKYALISIRASLCGIAPQGYSKDRVDGQNNYMNTRKLSTLVPATGYTIELTDVLNSSNIYATSASFEIKAVNSPYPAQTTPSASGSVVVASNAPTGSGTSAAASASASKGAAWPVAQPGVGVVGAVVMAGLGLLV